eukprot:COSAG01_NODE_8895_length_2623_cov_35.397781_3_plen_93_part_00
MRMELLLVAARAVLCGASITHASLHHQPRDQGLASAVAVAGGQVNVVARQVVALPPRRNFLLGRRIHIQTDASALHFCRPNAPMPWDIRKRT